MKNIIVVFDFDGVLVDSYSRLEEVYIKALRVHPTIREMNLGDVRRLARELVALEDYYDSIRRYNRFKLIETFLESKNLRVSKEIVERIVEEYWANRIKETIILPDAVETLRILHGKYMLILLTDHDGLPGMKLQRVRASGLDKYFNEIIVVGETGAPADKREGLIRLMRKYGVEPRRIVFVDDKPRVLESVKDLGVITILRKFKPPNMYLAWKGNNSSAEYVIESLTFLEKIISSIEKSMDKTSS